MEDKVECTFQNWTIINIGRAVRKLVRLPSVAEQQAKKILCEKHITDMGVNTRIRDIRRVPRRWRC